jgi:(p)ppGpp synthase/HD superfamily hydrolase
MAEAFASDSPLLEGAYRMAREAHHGRRREGDTDIDHPVEVAHLLSDTGFDERTVAAALLHDVVEDSATDTDEIEERFGAEVARLVAEMTEDTKIEPYENRKAEHRSRVARDRNVAAIYAADKLAGARATCSTIPTQFPDRSSTTTLNRWSRSATHTLIFPSSARCGASWSGSAKRGSPAAKPG